MYTLSEITINGFNKLGSRRTVHLYNNLHHFYNSGISWAEWSTGFCNDGIKVGGRRHKHSKAYKSVTREYRLMMLRMSRRLTTIKYNLS